MEGGAVKFVWRNEIIEAVLENGELHLSRDGRERETFEARIDGDRVITPAGRFRFAVAPTRDGVWVTAEGVTAFLEYPKPTAAAGAANDEIRSPMTGNVVSVNVAPGDAVKEGDLLAVVSAMKMEFRIESPRDGEVESVSCAVDQLVDLGAILVRLKDRS